LKKDKCEKKVKILEKKPKKIVSQISQSERLRRAKKRKKNPIFLFHRKKKNA